MLKLNYTKNLTSLSINCCQTIDKQYILTHPPTHPLTHSHIHSLTHSHTHSLTHSHTHSLTHSFTHPPAHSPTHSLTHPLTHPLTHLFIRSHQSLPSVCPSHHQVSCCSISLCATTNSSCWVISLLSRLASKDRPRHYDEPSQAPHVLHQKLLQHNKPQLLPEDEVHLTSQRCETLLQLSMFDLKWVSERSGVGEMSEWVEWVVSEWVSGWVSGWVGEWVSEWVSVWVSEWV